MSVVVSLPRKNNNDSSPFQTVATNRNCDASGDEENNPLQCFQKKKQQLPKGQHHAAAISRGKSLLPTKKRQKTNPKSLQQQQQQTTRKRRRCLPISKTTTTTIQSSTEASTEPKVQIKKNFPGKLFLLVESCTKNNNSSQNDQVLSWLPHPSTDSNLNTNKNGLLSLVVWDKNRLVDHDLFKTSFASQSTFRSFERQLNSWGFKRDHDLEDELLARQKQSTSNITTSNGNATSSNDNPTPTPILVTKVSLRAFYHPFFQEGKPGLLSGVKRRPPGSGNKDIKETIVQAASGLIAERVKAKPKTREEHSPLRTSQHRKLPPEKVPKAFSSSDSESTDHEIESEQQEDQSSIRTDIVLPSGVCLRINQRIPAWAIPAQEAAIRYLYQKHTKLAKRSPQISQKESDSSSTVHISKEQRVSFNPEREAQPTTMRTCNKSSCSKETLGRNPRNSNTPPRTAVSLQRPSNCVHHGEDSILGSLLQSRKGLSKHHMNVDSDCDGQFSDASEDEASTTLPTYNKDKTLLTKEKCKKKDCKDEMNEEEADEWLVI